MREERRRFLWSALALGACAVWRPRPVVARGRVTGSGGGLGGVAVTDGVSVVSTDADGSFEIPVDGSRSWLSVCVPPGYRLEGMFRPLTEVPVSFGLEPLHGRDDRHAFLVLADPQPADAGQAALFRAAIPDVAATVRALRVPSFAMVCGDIVGDAPALYAAHAETVRGIGAPVLHLAGNHDDPRLVRRFGPDRYSFDRGAVHYVVLDNVRRRRGGYEGRIGREQLAWLAADLARVERGRPVVVFAHIPLKGTFDERRDRSPAPWNSTTDRDALVALLEPYRGHFIAGHMHEHERGRVGAVREHVVGAVCGSWWNGPVNLDGTPNGYSVFEVSGESFRWRHKPTGSEKRLSVHSSGTEVIANVWDLDPDWEVTWSDARGRWGPMERFTGMDPLRKRMGAERHLTSHLFRAPGAPSLRVEARDPWGQVHVASC